MFYLLNVAADEQFDVCCEEKEQTVDYFFTSDYQTFSSLFIDDVSVALTLGVKL